MLVQNGPSSLTFIIFDTFPSEDVFSTAATQITTQIISLRGAPSVVHMVGIFFRKHYSETSISGPPTVPPKSGPVIQVDRLCVKVHIQNSMAGEIGACKKWTDPPDGPIIEVDRTSGFTALSNGAPPQISKSRLSLPFPNLHILCACLLTSGGFRAPSSKIGSKVS